MPLLLFAPFSSTTRSPARDCMKGSRSGQVTPGLSLPGGGLKVQRAAEQQAEEKEGKSRKEVKLKFV